MGVLPFSSGPRLRLSSIAEPSLLLGLPGVKDSSVWSQHVPGSALCSSNSQLGVFFHFFLVGQDISGYVFEFIRVTFLESSLYLVNQIGAIYLEPRSLTEYQGPFLAPCLLSRHLYL